MKMNYLFAAIIGTYMEYDITRSKNATLKLSKERRIALYNYCKENYKDWGGMYSFFFNLIEQ